MSNSNQFMKTGRAIGVAICVALTAPSCSVLPVKTGVVAIHPINDQLHIMLNPDQLTRVRLTCEVDESSDECRMTGCYEVRTADSGDAEHAQPTDKFCVAEVTPGSLSLFPGDGMSDWPHEIPLTRSAQPNVFTFTVEISSHATNAAGASIAAGTAPSTVAHNFKVTFDRCSADIEDDNTSGHLHGGVAHSTQ